MKVVDFPQGSAEWANARAGKVTASRVDDVLSRARDRKSEGATRRKYKAQIVAEILTGKPQEGRFFNKAMEDGIENEPFACGTYEAKHAFVDRVGFVLHPTIERAGASPDGLVGDKGLVEFKCPEPQTHLAYLLEGVVPSDYEPQMLWEMACTGREWVDFVSYCDLFPEHQLFVVRFNRDEARIRQITAEVTQFLNEVDEIIARLKQKAA